MSAGVRAWGLALTTWMYILTLAYFMLASYYTLRDWIYARPREKISVTFARKLAMVIYEVAFSFSLVVFLVHVLLAPSGGSGSEATRNTSPNPTSAHTHPALKTTLDLHTRYASFVWLSLDSIINAVEFRHSHVFFLFPVALIYMLFCGIDLYLWEPKTTTNTKTLGLSVISWSLLYVGVLCAFYVLLLWTEAKYMMLDWYEKKKGYLSRIPDKKEIDTSDREPLNNWRTA
ncbi:hypothetical protein AAMO2058_001258400 [Amorphochlora amoebiformis]